MSIPKHIVSKQMRSCTLISLNCNSLHLYLNQNTKFLDIMKQIQKSWNKNVQYIRLFKTDGQEVEEFDLVNIKNGTILYAELSYEDFKPNIIQNDYDIIKKIGEGGQGIVLLGRNKITKKMVALKKILIKNYRGSNYEEIFTESKILKGLDHQNIVKLYQDYLIHNQNEFIMVMEYLKGGSLINQANQNLTEAESKVYLKQIVDAIAYCHENNIVHCDLKLENIMLVSSTSKELKIIDFGVSNYIGKQLESENFVGTLSYLPPEILVTSKKQIQPSQDVWAIGCIIYGLVFGRLPFDGANSSDTFRNIINIKYSIPKQNVSQDLIDLFKKIFVNNVQERSTIFEIKSHPWFNQQPRLQKLLLQGNRKSSSMHSIKQKIAEDQIQVVSKQMIIQKRRSVIRFEKAQLIKKFN
ncbi:unnamed protein product [Paramecium primaurelia]|uniref:Protein kinase domain-containing protein n=1 Tax=Paramecium primaurelia TaxID=5886 RepID=A0A8S1Q4K6_PARPR|nr:unnamed protein product [Paramecium primaurelia]